MQGARRAVRPARRLTERVCPRHLLPARDSARTWATPSMPSIQARRSAIWTALAVHASSGSSKVAGLDVGHAGEDGLIGDRTGRCRNPGRNAAGHARTRHRPWSRPGHLQGRRRIASSRRSARRHGAGSPCSGRARCGVRLAGHLIANRAAMALALESWPSSRMSRDILAQLPEQNKNQSVRLASEHIFAEVGVAGDLGELALDIGGVDGHASRPCAARPRS